MVEVKVIWGSFVWEYFFDDDIFIIDKKWVIVISEYL